MNKGRSRSAQPQRRNNDLVPAKKEEDSPPQAQQGIPSAARLNQAQVGRLVRRLADSPASRIEDYGQELDRKTSELQVKRDKLWATVELLQLMQSSDMTVRCLQHNNILNLYCLSERRVLCVSCTYGHSRHKTHKVVPLKDASLQIQEDNERLRGALRLDLRDMEVSLKNAQGNAKALKASLSRALQQLQDSFAAQQHQLQEQKQRAVRKLGEQFQGLISKTLAVKQSLEEFKFKVSESLSVIGMAKATEGPGAEFAVLRQVCSSVFAELTPFQLAPITSKQLQRLQQLAQF